MAKRRRSRIVSTGFCTQRETWIWNIEVPVGPHRTQILHYLVNSEQLGKLGNQFLLAEKMTWKGRYTRRTDSFAKIEGSRANDRSVILTPLAYSEFRFHRTGSIQLRDNCECIELLGCGDFETRVFMTYYIDQVAKKACERDRHLLLYEHLTDGNHLG